MTDLRLIAGLNWSDRDSPSVVEPERIAVAPGEVTAPTVAPGWSAVVLEAGEGRSVRARHGSALVGGLADELHQLP